MIPKIEASFLRLDTSSGDSDSSYDGDYRGRFESFSSDSQYPERSESSSPFNDFTYNEGENKLKEQLKKFENCLYDDAPYDGLPQPLVREAEIWKSYSLHIRVIGKKIELTRRMSEEKTTNIPVYTEQDLVRDFPEHDVSKEKLYLESLEGVQKETKMTKEPEVVARDPTQEFPSRVDEAIEPGHEEIIEKHGEYEDVSDSPKIKGFTREEKNKLSEDIKKEVLQRLLQGIWPSIMEKADPILKLTQEKKMRRSQETKKIEVIKPTTVYCLPAPPKELLGKKFAFSEKPQPISILEGEIEKVSIRETVKSSPRYLSHTAQPVSRKPVVESARNHSSLSARSTSQKDSMDIMRRELRTTLLNNGRIMKSTSSNLLPPIDLNKRTVSTRTCSLPKLPQSRSSSISSTKRAPLKRNPAPPLLSMTSRKKEKPKDDLSGSVIVSSFPPPSSAPQRNTTKNLE